MAKSTFASGQASTLERLMSFIPLEKKWTNPERAFLEQLVRNRGYGIHWKGLTAF
ncbi:Hypothetical protein Minf_0139 [Methylacidiphilum infernorum V4]|uniref:Uncharacterized protein n=1 Tax=Methylacidiphilum infernorum (isolate V4) TaxID=481448 RepID=B3DX59_METI4|nr:Hypothetical protein Minf_0139 [Methylacidiphilum infernorum V4]